MRTARKTNVVYSYLLHGIESGKFRIGERIPAERDLAAQFKLSRPTVMAAIRRLVKENMIRRGRRTGSVVMNLPPRKSRTFGAIILGLVRQPQEQSIFNAVGNAISYCAASDHSVVLLQDPSWGDDPNIPGMAERYRSITDQFIARKVDGVFLMPQWIMPDQQI
ncbi:MAG: GntR family transcriptional regulator, partial [Phycisphaerae bacterium]|nr:GntR family transcriptional regulator [Phycisphaerae bacterium]